MGKYSCPCLRFWDTGKRVRLPMPPLFVSISASFLLTILREEGIDCFLVGDGVDHVTIGFPLAGFQRTQQASRSVLVAPFDASRRWLQGSHVLIFAPVLPIGAARKIMDVVTDGNRQWDFCISDGDTSHAILVRFGIDVADERCRAAMLGEYIGDSLVQPAFDEVRGRGFVARQRLDALLRVAKLGAKIEQRITEVD